MTDGIPKLLTEKDAAVALGISIDTLRRERKRQRIGYTVIGGRVRYTQEQLSAYIAKGSISPCSASAPNTPDRSKINGAPSVATAPSEIVVDQRLPRTTSPRA